MSLPFPLVISNASSITISAYEQFQGFGHDFQKLACV
jgi:hypothetical protein